MDRLTACDKGYAYFPKCFEEPYGGNGCTKENCDFMESLCTKLAQYEDIGTLEEFKFLKENRFTHTELAEIACGLNRLAKYEDIGTLEEVREAVEKQNEKNPTYDGDGYAPDGSFVWDEWLCPRCGSRFEVDYDDYNYCPNCGHHIDWSEGE